ncbi:hypothetical protein N2152v2_010042 [Parachlorella kessleri]
MVRLWQRADVYIYEVYSLRRVLHSLGSSEGRVGSTGSLQRLTLHFAADGWGWWTLPEEVGKLTTLTKLKLLHFDENMPIPPAAALGWLSTLTALQSLLVIAPISGPWPSPALSSLQQLTNLSMCFWDPDESYPAPQLGSAHLAPLKALRRLDLDNIMLSMSGKQVLGSWQHMEELSLSDVGPYSLGFWEALCRLPRLTKLVSNCDHEESSASLRSTLSAFPRLAELWLNGYSEPALPHLPTTLTHINLYWTPDLCAIPFGPALRSLHLFNKWGFHHTVIQEFPPQLSAMTQLTKLELDVCNLTELPAPLAALPSLEILSLKQNYLEDLPQDLASMGCLRTLILDGNLLQRDARSAGLEGEYLRFCSQKAQLWQRAEVQAQHGEELSRVLQTLDALSGSAATGSGLVRLKLWAVYDSQGRPGFSRVLGQLTRLTCLKLLHNDYEVPLCPAQLTALSFLTALRSLKIHALITTPLPATAFQSLAQLTSLWMQLWALPEKPTAPLLCSDHLSALTALRRLDLRGFGLSLLAEMVLTAWQHLEKLTLSCVPFRGDKAELWGPLCRLPRLTSLVSNRMCDQPSQVLRSTLQAFPQLAELRLVGYSEPAMPQLPTTLTCLELCNSDLRVVPACPSLVSLSIGQIANKTVECPACLSAMILLTELGLGGCLLAELPAPVVGLPGLKKLCLSMNDLTDLPQELACVGCLQTLLIEGNLMQEVPRVLTSGAASRLESLVMEWTRARSWAPVDDVALRASLPALTHLNLPRAWPEEEEMWPEEEE